MILRWIAALLLAAFVVAGCEGGTLGSETPTVVDSPTDGVDATLSGDTSTDVADPPTLAPVPPGVTAGPKCDAAFKTWVDWWVAVTSTDTSLDPSFDPNATPSEVPGDPDKLDHDLFSSCTLAELGAANAAHPVTLEPGDPPAPYIQEEIGSYVAGLCDEEPDVIGDTELCKPSPSPSP